MPGSLLIFKMIHRACEIRTEWQNRRELGDSMRAAFGAPGGVEVRDTADPGGPGLLVRVHSVSICGSDQLYLKLGSRQILGHEIAGYLEDGSLVAVEPVFGCGDCELCAIGSHNLCVAAATQVLGLTAPGGMAEYLVAPERAVTRLPAGIESRNASIVEPAAVALHAGHAGDISSETSVAVVGGGAIGQLCVVAARHLGAPVVALEARHPHQKDAGERFGAGAPAGLYDVVLEASGSESGLHRAAQLVRPKGTIVLVGVYSPKIKWPSMDIFFKEATLKAAFGYCAHDGKREFEEIAEVLAVRPDVAETLVTHRFDLERAPEAFEAARNRSSGAFRVVVHPWGEC